MLLSDAIAKMIEEMLTDCGGTLELRRNDMAERMGCAPSQINYVITSRFTPERGYIIESRRGGGGYVRIVRKQMQRNEYLMHFFHAVGESLDERTAVALVTNLTDAGIISGKLPEVLTSTLSNASLQAITDKQLKDRVRADLMRQIVLSLMK